MAPFMFDIDPRSPVPLGEQVRRAVRRAIAEGRVSKGDPLPPVRRVAADAGINLNTVARAYRELESEGLVVTVRGRGTEVKAERETRKLSKRELQLRARDLLADALLGGHTRQTVRSLLKLGDAMRVAAWTPDRDGAVLTFLGNREEGRGHCFCTAWWCPTWEAWKGRTAAENRAEREALVARGERDGFLLLDGDAVAGWCQVGPRDRLRKLARQYGLPPDPAAWAITCFEVAPARRGRGAARILLEGVLAALAERGVRRVEAFPRPGRLEPGEAWTGPESLFRGAGFLPAGRGDGGPVVVLDPVRSRGREE